MKLEDYLDLKAKVIQAGYEKEIEWAESLRLCTSASKFFDEYIWVVLNAGMREQVARGIYSKVQEALQLGVPVLEVFRHTGKAAAIEKMANNYPAIFNDFLKSTNKLVFLGSLDWIGKVTKYHLAKNLGIDCVKPDRHLVRIAKEYGVTCVDLCRQLSIESGDTLATVDQVIWRAANLRYI